MISTKGWMLINICLDSYTNELKELQTDIDNIYLYMLYLYINT